LQFEEPREKRRWVNSPILWLLSGILFTVLVIIGSLMILTQSLTQNRPDSLSSIEISNAPTIIRITAPATSIPTETPIIPTPTSEPKLTPSPTPNRLVATENITNGFYAEVANTDGFGVKFRTGYGLGNDLISVLEEETVGLVIDGPVESDGFIWWRLELEDTTQGWAVEQFLAPANEPTNWRSQ
jgi:hypothetical protein